MKKLKYTLIALLVLCMTGCNESSFLKEDPRASLYPENLLVDYSGFQSMVTSLYGMMRNEYRRADALGGGLPLVLHSAWGCGVDNSWSNNSHSDFKYMYYPSQINQTDLQIFQKHLPMVLPHHQYSKHGDFTRRRQWHRLERNRNRSCRSQE